MWGHKLNHVTQLYLQAPSEVPDLTRLLCQGIVPVVTHMVGIIHQGEILRVLIRFVMIQVVYYSPLFRIEIVLPIYLYHTLDASSKELWDPISEVFDYEP